MAAGTQIVVRVDDDLLVWIDAHRAERSRAQFLKRLAERVKEGTPAERMPDRLPTAGVSVRPNEATRAKFLAGCDHPAKARLKLKAGVQCGACLQWL